MVVYAPAQIISAPAQLITAPAQPPATGAVVYTALFFLLSHLLLLFVAGNANFKSLFRSVGRSVRPSVRWSVRRSHFTFSAFLSCLKVE